MPQEMSDEIRLRALLREIESTHFTKEIDGLDESRSAMLARLGDYRHSRYKWGKAMYQYRQMLPHGAWGPMVTAIAGATKITGRTVHEILADFKKTLGIPASLIEALEQKGIDPAMKRNLNVVKMTTALVEEEGVEPTTTVETALKSLPSPLMPLGAPGQAKSERQHHDALVHFRNAIARQARNKRFDFAIEIISEELIAQGLLTEPRTIVLIPVQQIRISTGINRHEGNMQTSGLKDRRGHQSAS